MELVNIKKNNKKVELSEINSTNYLYIEGGLDEVLDLMKQDGIVEVEDNSNIPIKIEKNDICYTPVIYFDRNRIDSDLKNPRYKEEWICEYWDKHSRNSHNNFNELFKVEAESLEELIGKTSKLITDKKYHLNYDLTYNFKKYV